MYVLFDRADEPLGVNDDVLPYTKGIYVDDVDALSREVTVVRSRRVMDGEDQLYVDAHGVVDTTGDEPYRITAETVETISVSDHPAEFSKDVVKDYRLLEIITKFPEAMEGRLIVDNFADVVDADASTDVVIGIDRVTIHDRLVAYVPEADGDVFLYLRMDGSPTVQVGPSEERLVPLGFLGEATADRGLVITITGEAVLHELAVLW